MENGQAPLPSPSLSRFGITDASSPRREEFIHLFSGIFIYSLENNFPMSLPNINLKRSCLHVLGFFSHHFELHESGGACWWAAVWPGSVPYI